MHLISYISDYNESAGAPDAVLKDIVTTSKKNNASKDITGVLFFLENQFLQVIEGEEADLRSLMPIIEQDNRHSNIRVLIDTDQAERGFKDWKMDAIHLKAGKVFDANYLTAITNSFQNMMVPSSNELVTFYKSLMHERKKILGIF